MTDEPQSPPPGPRAEPGPAPKVPGGASSRRPRSEPGSPAASQSATATPILRVSGRGGGRFADDPPPPEKPTLKGAPLTLALLLAMVAIELLLTFSQAFPGAAADSARRQAYLWFALFPVEPIAVWYGEASPTALLGLATHMLMHGGLLHLLFNGAATLVLGPPLERALGTLRFAFLFFVAGVVGGLSHVGWELAVYALDAAKDASGLATPLVGASGAICGLLGAQIVGQARLARRFARDPGQVKAATSHALRTSLVFIGLNLALMLIDSFISGAAHVGGYIAGAAIAALLPLSPR